MMIHPIHTTISAARGDRSRACRLASRLWAAFTVAACLMAGSGLLGSGPAHAANIWDGGGADANWSTVGNWDNNQLPGTGALTFSGTTQTSTTNNLTAALPYAGIIFANNGSTGQTSAFTLAGNSITLGGDITTTANFRTAFSSITDVISLDLILNGNRTITTNQLSSSVQHNLAISGVISEDATARSLTKAGAGTLTLNGSGASTFTGGLNVNGGTLLLDFATMTSPTNLIAAGNALTLGGGGLTVVAKNDVASAQTLGGVTINAGRITVNGAGTGTMNLTTGAWTRNTGGTVNVVLGSGGTLTASPTLSNDIIGPWATFGTGADTRYATVSSGQIAGYTGGTAAATAADLTDTTGTVNYDLAAAAGTVPASMTANTIRYTGGAATTAPGATLFSVNGLLNAGSGAWTIGTNALTIGGSRELVVNTASNGITITGNVLDNAGGASAIVKDGTGTLTLTGAKSYSGGTIMNGGELSWSVATSLGSGALTVNADSNLIPGGTLTESRPIVLNNGAIATFTGTVARTWTTTGPVSGSGGFYLVSGAGGGNSSVVYLNSGNNTFTGPITVDNTGGTGAGQRTFGVASLADSDSPITFTGTAVNPTLFMLTQSAVKPLVLTERQFVLDRTSSNSLYFPYIRNDYRSTLNTITINSDLYVTPGTGPTGIRLEAQSINSGDNTFAGVIGNGDGGFTVVKSQNGRFVLSGSNTYTGNTIVENGLLRARDGVGLPSASNLELKGGSFETDVNFARPSGTSAGQVSFASTAGFSARGADISVALGLNGNLENLTWGTAPFAPTTFVLNHSTATHAIDFENNINLGTAARTISAGANVATLSGVISSTDANGGITKISAGVLVLSGTNTYSGQTLVSGGVLRAASGTGLPTDSRLTLNGGIFETGTNFARTGGTASGNVEISGGTSGFSARGADIDVAFLDADGITRTALTWGTAPFAPGTLVLNAATADSAIDFKNNINLATAARTIQVDANTATLSGVISSDSTAGGITKTGVGKLVLAGANSYTGPTLLSGGTLAITGAHTAGSAVTVSTTGTLDLGDGGATGSLDSSSTLTLNGGQFAYTRTGDTTQSFASTAINSAPTDVITIRAGNTLDLGTASRGAGVALDFATIGPGIRAGTASNDASGIMPGFVFGNSWAVANGPSADISGFTGYTLSSNAGSTAAQYAGNNVDVNSSPGLLDGVITANSLRFSANAANTLSLADGINTVTTGGIMVTSDVGSHLSTISGGTLAGAASKDLSIYQNNTSGGLTISSVIANNGGATRLTKSGAGVLTLSGANTYTGNTSVRGGTLVIDGSTAAGGFLDVFTGASAVVNGTINGGADSRAGGSLVVNSGGSIAGTSFVSGSFIVNAGGTIAGFSVNAGGTLVLNGTSSGTGNAVAGTLKGSGSVTGSVTIDNGGILAPGNSIESLATGALSLNLGSTFEMEIDKSALPSLAGDLVAVTGNLSLVNPTLQLVELGSSGVWGVGDKLTLISYSGTWNGGLFWLGGSTLLDDSTISFGGADWLFNYNDTVAGTNFTGDLTGPSFVTMTAVVPEPGAVLLAGFGLLVGLGLPALRRRRRAGADRA